MNKQRVFTVTVDAPPNMTEEKVKHLLEKIIAAGQQDALDTVEEDDEEFNPEAADALLLDITVS